MSSLPARTRILAVGEVLREAGGYDGPLAAPGIWREVRVKPLTPETRSTAPRRDILVAGFSFRIGRKPLRHEQTPCT